MSSTISKTHDLSVWNNLPRKIKDDLQKIDSDSKIYQMVDEKCFFCNTKITKQDVNPPNEIYDAVLDGERVVSHGKCMEYTVRKYPHVPVVQLEGKIIRIKVDQSVI